VSPAVPTGEAIREIRQYDKAGEAIADETEVLLFAASRAQLVRHVVEPALEAGQCVVCDRDVDSTTAYQGYGRGFPLEQFTAINRFATGDTLPDLTLLLDLEIAAGMARLQDRHQSESTTYDRIEREERAFHEKVRQGYLTLAREEPTRFRVFNATPPAEDLAEQIWSEVRDVLRK
jgi:dTMP kinase